MKTKNLLLSHPVFEIIFFFLVSGFVYLPNIANLTYYKDDWYYIYDAYVAGPKIFHAMFAIDRPARGIFFEIYYSLFGPYPLPYHIGAFLWRMVAAVSALWLFNLLWSKQRKFAFFAALLFALYPGYFWWISAIEYQPMIASLALQVLSIALTIKAIQASRVVSKTFYLVGAILLGWTYIALVDYAIGMEFFRFLCVYLYVRRERQTAAFGKTISASIRAWAWNFLVPLGFLLWRTFIFQNERKATDIDLQLGALMHSPASTLMNWSLNFLNSILDLGMLAWINQFKGFFFGMRTRDIAYGLTFAGAALLLVFLFSRLLKREDDNSSSNSAMGKEALALGLLGMAIGILPVIMANRYIDLVYFSHYALPASLAAALALMGFSYCFLSPRIRYFSLYTAIVLAALAHYSISIYALNEENAIAEFWWQAYWRVPAIRPGTTLLVQYPYSDIGDNRMGEMLGTLEAANLMYFPGQNDAIPVHYPLGVLVIYDAYVKELMGKQIYKEAAYRSDTVNFDFGNVLVLSQPTPTSCVRVIDGNDYLPSFEDSTDTLAAASYSKIENVLTSGNPIAPQEFAFGAEPPHRWCYYFEKADLAAQQLKWQEVASLGDKAMSLGLHPEDQAEWFPFLKAYAILGNEKKVKTIAHKINTEPFLEEQTCKAFTESANPNYNLKPQTQKLINELFCGNK